MSAAGRDRLELAAAVLLALAAVATAWSSYQATRWNGEQAKTASRVNKVRIDAARAADLARSQTQIDIATFIQWVDAYAQDKPELANFYRTRFRAEFKPAFGRGWPRDLYERRELHRRRSRCRSTASPQPATPLGSTRRRRCSRPR